MTPTLKIAAINHQDGGLEPRAGGGRRDRLDAQLDLLTALDLDVVFSTEGKGWLDNDNFVLKYAAHRLKMVPHVAVAPRHDCNLVIWLREGRFHEIVEHHELRPPFWHAQARVSARLDGLDQPLWLFAAHFSPFVPAVRTAEAYATAELAADGRLVIGAGDFQDDPSAEEAPDRSHLDPARRLRYGVPGDPQSPSALLRTAGLVDVAAALGSRDATAGFVDGAPLRCDRIYLSEALRSAPRTYRVHPDSGDRLSDHRMITAELDLGCASR